MTARSIATRTNSSRASSSSIESPMSWITVRCCREITPRSSASTATANRAHRSADSESRRVTVHSDTRVLVASSAMSARRSSSSRRRCAMLAPSGAETAAEASASSRISAASSAARRTRPTSNAPTMRPVSAHPGADPRGMRRHGRSQTGKVQMDEETPARPAPALSHRSAATPRLLSPSEGEPSLYRISLLQATVNLFTSQEHIPDDPTPASIVVQAVKTRRATRRRSGRTPATSSRRYSSASASIPEACALRCLSAPEPSRSTRWNSSSTSPRSSASRR